MSGPGDWEGYVRWRPWMVRQSVYDDLVATLENIGWIPGTPYSFMEGHPLTVVDSFPDEAPEKGVKIATNTLAIDEGEPGEEYTYELGGMEAQDYTFLLAFYAANDVTAQALFQDLADRYMGRTESPFVSLMNYAVETDDPELVVRMEVESFLFRRSVDQISPGHDLYVAELVVTDFLTRQRTEEVVP